MRHLTGGFLVLPVLFCAIAWADEAADRAAISHTVVALNVYPPRAELFTADADAAPVLDQLWSGKRIEYRLAPETAAVESLESDLPTVVVSHRPWGEATISYPGRGIMTAMEMLNPRIAASAVRFVTADVALADGACTYRQYSAGTQTTPLLFVMKREGEAWKIASVRVLAPAPSEAVALSR